MQETAVRPFSTGDALRFGWDVFKKNLNPLVLFGVGSAFLALLGSALQQAGRVGAPLAFVVQLLQGLVMLALIRVGLKLLDGEPLDFSQPAKWLDGFGGYLVTAFLYAVITTFGFMLLIVPGVIWGLMFGLAPFLAADKGTEPIEALKQSAALTRGIRTQLFFFALAMLGINLLGVIALGVGLIVTMPWTVLSAVYVYRKVLERGPQEEAHTPTLPTPKPA